MGFKLKLGGDQKYHITIIQMAVVINNNRHLNVQIRIQPLNADNSDSGNPHYLHIELPSKDAFELYNNVHDKRLKLDFDFSAEAP